MTAAPTPSAPALRSPTLSWRGGGRAEVLDPGPSTAGRRRKKALTESLRWTSLSFGDNLWMISTTPVGHLLYVVNPFMGVKS